jgi:hypothetical protein
LWTGLGLEQGAHDMIFKMVMDLPFKYKLGIVVTEGTLDSQKILNFTAVVSDLFDDDISTSDYVTSNDGMISA